MDFIKTTDDGWNWYNKMVNLYGNTFEQVDVWQDVSDERNIKWNVSNPLSGKHLDGGMAVSLRQAEYFADQSINNRHPELRRTYAPRGGLL